MRAGHRTVDGHEHPINDYGVGRSRMGLFDRLRAAQPKRIYHGSGTPHLPARLFEGDEDLEVVGEASYQDALWLICGGVTGERVRREVVATLVPEPDNTYDPNAISVRVDGHRVGYLSRDNAVRYGPGIRSLMAETNGLVALRAVIAGGGNFADGLGRLGVWLRHDPSDFGLQGPVDPSRVAGPGSVRGRPSMRTGFSDAQATDEADDSYDLSWFDTLPVADRPAVAHLRKLLEEERDPISRHFQFAELGSRLYRCRDLYAEALAEFDEVCHQHDAEMDRIAAAFIGKWGTIPMLELYRQMAIRQQKLQNWEACRWWAERGLAVYGGKCSREDAVEDLQKRRNRALAKLNPPPKAPSERSAVHAARGPARAETGIRSDGPVEQLTCTQCGLDFERVRARGRKPLLCPSCRAVGDP